MCAYLCVLQYLPHLESFRIKMTLDHKSMQFPKYHSIGKIASFMLLISHYNTEITQGDSGTYLGSIHIAMVKKKIKMKHLYKIMKRLLEETQFRCKALQHMEALLLNPKGKTIKPKILTKKNRLWNNAHSFHQPDVQQIPHLI